MATLEERKQFFAHRPNYHSVKMEGKSLHVVNLPKEDQEFIKKRLAEKDDVMAEGLKGILPGLKINGRQVTKDNIHEFEKGFKEEKPKVTKEEKVEENIESKPKYVKEELENMSFSKLKALARTLGEVGRSSVGLIKDILTHN